MSLYQKGVSFTLTLRYYPLMPFAYTLMQTETLSGNKRRWYGYDVLTFGTILNMRVNNDVPGGTEVKVLDKEIFVPDDTVSGLSGALSSFVDLLEELDSSTGMTRKIRATNTPSGHALVHVATKIVFKVAGTSRTIYPDETIYVVEGAYVDDVNLEIGPIPPPPPP